MFAVSIASLFIASCSQKEIKPEAKPALVLPTTVADAVKSSFRNPENTKRDQYRHPAETLTFFGIQPEMTVVEIAPGGGWYMEILAPFLASKGQYIAAGFSRETTVDFQKELNAKIDGWLAKYPEAGAKAKIVAFNPPNEIAPADSVDMVLTFRNIHNWMPNEKEAFKTFFKALKPGGTLGVVEHRADPKAKHDPKAKSGYVSEKHVIKIAQSVGFKLAEKSEINANPKDTKNYPEGVWTLPPTFRLKDVDKDKYIAIGESDRMTLRFIKPVKKSKK
ncbi:MAG: class I SAM-dependent methyltransferase [Bdellovibrionaceae bacterium]|nr:class I SAM-dependent methyltransferase [Pseudobdellovibrionaceae bacterium]